MASDSVSAEDLLARLQREVNEHRKAAMEVLPRQIADEERRLQQLQVRGGCGCGWVGCAAWNGLPLPSLLITRSAP